LEEIKGKKIQAKSPPSEYEDGAPAKEIAPTGVSVLLEMK
jgi:hypothetical protein